MGTDLRRIGDSRCRWLGHGFRALQRFYAGIFARWYRRRRSGVSHCGVCTHLAAKRPRLNVAIRASGAGGRGTSTAQFVVWQDRWQPARFTATDRAAGDALITRIALIDGAVWVPFNLISVFLTARIRP